MDFRQPTQTYTTFTAPVITSPHGLLEDVEVLSPSQAEAMRRKQVPKWQLAEGRLQRTFAFEAVSESQSFTHRVQGLSHSRNQHPHIFVDFKSVHIELWTQGLGGITSHDFDLAELVDQAVEMP